jgi:hypothetical protein
MIDRTSLLPHSGVGVIGPWLVMAPADSKQVIRIDLRQLDRVGITGPGPGRMGQLDVYLECGDLAVALGIADGPAAARRIAKRAAVHTREQTNLTASGALEPFIFVDEDAVVLRGEYLQVGNVAFRVNEVRDYALRGANIPLTQGRLLQAAMAMLVVAAAERDSAAESL